MKPVTSESEPLIQFSWRGHSLSPASFDLDGRKDSVQPAGRLSHCTDHIAPGDLEAAQHLMK